MFRGRFVAVGMAMALLACHRMAIVPGREVPRLQALASRDEVDLPAGDEWVTVTRRTMLRLHVRRLGVVATRADRMGFGPAALRVGEPWDPEGGIVPYHEISHMEVRQIDTLPTLLWVFVPIGVVLGLYGLCRATSDHGCAPGT